jgi:hypothetical protein
VPHEPDEDFFWRGSVCPNQKHNPKAATGATSTGTWKKEAANQTSRTSSKTQTH